MTLRGGAGGTGSSISTSTNLTSCTSATGIQAGVLGSTTAQFSDATIYVRVGTGTGAADTCDVFVEIIDLTP